MRSFQSMFSGSMMKTRERKCDGGCCSEVMVMKGRNCAVAWLWWLVSKGRYGWNGGFDIWFGEVSLVLLCYREYSVHSSCQTTNEHKTCMSSKPHGQWTFEYIAFSSLVQLLPLMEREGNTAPKNRRVIATEPLRIIQEYDTATKLTLQYFNMKRTAKVTTHIIFCNATLANQTIFTFCQSHLEHKYLVYPVRRFCVLSRWPAFFFNFF